jgi:hypothetical protein
MYSSSGLRPSDLAHSWCSYTGLLHENKLTESMMKISLSEFHTISMTIRLCATQPANQGLIPLDSAPLQQSTPPSSLWFLKLWYAYHYWHTKQCLLVLTLKTPGIMFHVTFYLSNISAHILQAIHYLATTLIHYSTELCHLHRILDTVL